MKTFESFDQLDIPASIKQSLTAMSFLAPTPVQARAIPAGLEGKDIIGTAQTGTGKTGAFGVPMLTALYKSPGKKALVLAPTRELAAQTQKVLKAMGKHSDLKSALVVGGESFNRQVSELSRDIDFVVATPGRLTDHLKEGTIQLHGVAVLVLDEVDRMLDMGFLPQIREILSYVPSERQTLLFSATLPAEVTKLIQTLVRNPVRVSVDDVTKTASQVSETMIHVKHAQKNQVLLAELAKRDGKTLVFVRTQSRTRRLLTLLESKKLPAVCLHGGRTQGQRRQAMERFRSGSHPIMVATDLAGRGLDIPDIDHVINFDVPGTREDYIHRIGRTGRAGKPGSAISFVDPEDPSQETVVLGHPNRKPAPPSAKRRPEQARRKRRFGGGGGRRFARRFN